MLTQPFFQVALPIMFTMLLAVWANSKGFDGVNKRVDDVVSRLGRVEDRLIGIETRLGAVERKVARLRSRRGGKPSLA